MDAAKRDQLIHTALHDTDGESVEGGFVDYYVYYADTARAELVSHFSEHGLTEADATAVRAALRQSEVPPETGARLLHALQHWLPQEAEALFQEADPALRTIAVQVLNRPIHWYEKKPTYPRGLEDSSAYVRIAALKTLIEHHRSVPDFPALLYRMLDDPEPAVRRLVVKSLGFFRNPENQSALTRTLDCDPDQTVRNTVLRYVTEETRRLGVHYSPETVAEGIGEELTERLIAALEHSDPEQRALVARALERVAGINVVEAMFARLQQERNHDACCALLYFPRYSLISERAFPVLQAIIQDRSHGSQQTLAAWLLPAFGAAAEPDLRATLDAANPDGTRRAAAMGLGGIGTLSSLPALIHTWRDPIMKFGDREVERAIRDVVIRAAHKASCALLPDITERIQQCLADCETGHYDLRHHCKVTLGALPIHATLIYLWAIRPDCSVLCIDHEAFGYPSELETDPLTVFAVWVHAAERYPELAAGIPQPPEDTEPCTPCRAQGYYGQGDHCFNCSGLGWKLRP